MHLGTFSKPAHNVYHGQKVISESTYEYSASKPKFLGDILILGHFKDFLEMSVNASF